MANLFTQDAEDLHNCKKTITDKIEPFSDGKNIYFKVTVCTEMGEPLMLRCHFYKKYSFSLLYRNSIPIRRWDYKHTGEIKVNTNGKKILIPTNKGHKHKWDEITRDKEFYPVNDIPTDDFQKAFFAFLKEENIEFSGTFPIIPIFGGD